MEDGQGMDLQGYIGSKWLHEMGRLFGFYTTNPQFSNLRFLSCPRNDGRRWLHRPTPSMLSTPTNDPAEPLQRTFIVHPYRSLLIHHTLGVAYLLPHTDFSVPQPRSHRGHHCQSLSVTSHDG